MSGWASWGWRWLLGVLPLDLVSPPPLRADLVAFGLGNPGAKHAYTRHNAGILAAARLAELCGAGPFRRHRDALVALGRAGERSVLVVLPRVWMNVNGPVAARVAALAGCPRERLLVLHDDEQVPGGDVRVARDGDTHAHRGLASVATAVGGAGFPRVRVGTGPRPDRRDVSHLVTPLHGAERDALLASAAAGAAAAFAVAAHGLARAQHAINTSSKATGRRPSLDVPERAPAPVACSAPALPSTAGAALVPWAGRVGALCWRSSLSLLLGLARGHRSLLGARSRVVAVIGSFGKTSTSRAVAAALGIPRAHPWHTSGVNAYHYMIMLALRTRPWHAHEVLEVGIDRPGYMARYARAFRPDLVVFTCLGSEHQGSFVSLEEKRDEKARMLEGLRPGGVLVANGDCPHVQHVAAGFRGRVVRFGFEPHNDVRATDVRLDFPHGTRFVLHARGTSTPVLVPVLGPAMVRAALGGVAVALTEGVEIAAAVERLERTAAHPHRLEPLRTPLGAWLLRDEVKSHEETVAAALDVLAGLTAWRRTVVLGSLEEPGPGSKVRYAAVGERAARSADRLVVLGEHYREYARGAQRAGMAPEDVFDGGRDLGAVLARLLEYLGPKDVVLIKGRSTEHLERLSAALLGHEVRCTTVPCSLGAGRRCERCPGLLRGPRDLAAQPTPR